MPTYPYLCDNCGHEFETVQRMSEAALTECPNCHTAALHRVITLGGGFVLKGSGFYNTDYKNAPPKPVAGGAKSGEAKSGESKPDAATAGASADRAADKAAERTSDGGKSGAADSDGGSKPKPESKSAPKPESTPDSKSDSKKESGSNSPSPKTSAS